MKLQSVTVAVPSCITIAPPFPFKTTELVVKLFLVALKKAPYEYRAPAHKFALLLDIVLSWIVTMLLLTIADAFILKLICIAPPVSFAMLWLSTLLFTLRMALFVNTTPPNRFATL